MDMISELTNSMRELGEYIHDEVNGYDSQTIFRAIEVIEELSEKNRALSDECKKTYDQMMEVEKEFLKCREENDVLKNRCAALSQHESCGLCGMKAVLDREDGAENDK